MLIRRNLAIILTRYKREHGLSLEGLAKLLDISVNAVQSYCKGTCNLRVDTLELILRKLGLPLSAILTVSPSEQELARSIVYISELFAALTPEDRETGSHIVVELIALLSGERIQ